MSEAISSKPVADQAPSAHGVLRGTARHCVPSDSMRWRGALGAILLLTLGVMALRHWPDHLDEYDEAKQAYASYEIVRGGSWWYQHAPFGAHATKPPLLAWISVGLYRLTGHWTFAWRFPSLAAVAGTAWLLYRLGERRLPGVGGALASLAFVISQMTLRLALMARTDALLAFWVTALAALLLTRLEHPAPWRLGDRILLGAMLTAALFTKGPVIYAFTAASLLSLTGHPRRWFPEGFSVRTGGWPWLISLMLFLAWALTGALRQSSFADDVVWREFGSNFRISKPPLLWLLEAPLRYPLVLLHRWLPWSLLALPLARHRPVRAALWREPTSRWLLLTVGIGIAIMSLVPSKRADRIFPLLPPLCLLLVEAARAAGRSAPSGAWSSVAGGRKLALRVGWIGLLIWGGYVGVRAAQSHRRGNAGLVAFGAQIRTIAEERDWSIGIDMEVAIETGLVLYANTDYRHVWPRSRILADARAAPVDAFVLYSVREAEISDPAWKVVLRSHPDRAHPERCSLVARVSNPEGDARVAHQKTIPLKKPADSRDAG